MWCRLFLAACAALAFAGTAAPSAAERTPATDLSYEDDYAYAEHAPLFASHEVFSPGIARFPQWTDMLARRDGELRAADHLCASAAETRCVPREWQVLIDQLHGLDLRTKVERVNAAMNKHPYVTTAENWHRSMYWETAFEFLRYGGQCQDYAIAKYQLLRALGVPADLMRMVVLRDTLLGLDHAVLAVYLHGEPVILDNLRPDILPASQVSFYRPYYSINESGWWYHFGGQAMTRVALVTP
jgi:predicted transglutaminase-like cysteine proteinase